MIRLIFAAVLVMPSFFFSCTTRDNTLAVNSSDGYAPVYANPADVVQIALDSGKNTLAPGKLYTVGNYIYQNDINTGIHIINIADRSHPVKVAFLKVPFSTEVAVKGNYLYTNNLRDLVVFDITNKSKPQLVKRIENVFPFVDQRYPPFSNVSFECPDPSKGIVIRWERKTLTNAKCRR